MKSESPVIKEKVVVNVDLEKFKSGIKRLRETLMYSSSPGRNQRIEIGEAHTTTNLRFKKMSKEDR